MTPTLILLEYLHAALGVRDNPYLTPEQRRVVLADLRTNIPSRYDHASAMGLRGVVLGVLDGALKEDPDGSTGGTAEGPREEVAQQEPGGPVHDSDGESPTGEEGGGRKRTVRRRQS